MNTMARPWLGSCRAVWTGAALCLGSTTALAEHVQVAVNLAEMSLEQLREVVVTTVSLRAEGLDRAAASVYVISADDIRRSGARTIPEALRLAPTLGVARADANQYAISARGFNNVLANKMLVVIDGRAVYSPLFSGVFWEAQDVVLDDVDRIEVVTGPSTALWGSNAVNALIHIITRSAGASQGLQVALDAGNRGRGGLIRYAAKAGVDGHFRLYAKSYARSESHRADGSSIGDAADGTQTGFRSDWDFGGQRLTLQGDAYHATIDQGPTSRRISGANVLGRWERTFDAESKASVQIYADRTTRNQAPVIIEALETIDAIGQYSVRLAGRHQVLVGAGYRHSRDDLTTFSALSFNPPSRSLSWARVFGQDAIELSDALSLTLSTSVESNPYTRAQVLPSLRLAYRPTPNALWWGSVSRAVRAPSRIDREFVQPAQPPYVVAGGPNFVSEVAHVVELGYRAQPTPELSYSLTLFQHDYSRLRSLAPTSRGLEFENGLRGRTRGLEAWARWRPADHWRLDAGLTLLNDRISLAPGAVDVAGAQGLGNDPPRTWSLRSSADVAPGVAWDLMLRHVGGLPAPIVPSYTAVDTRLAWRISPTTELALVVQNLFDPRHAEWGAPGNRVELERSARVQFRWQHQ